MEFTNEIRRGGTINPKASEMGVRFRSRHAIETHLHEAIADVDDLCLEVLLDIRDLLGMQMTKREEVQMPVPRGTRTGRHSTRKGVQRESVPR